MHSVFVCAHILNLNVVVVASRPTFKRKIYGKRRLLRWNLAIFGNQPLYQPYVYFSIEDISFLLGLLHAILHFFYTNISLWSTKRITTTIGTTIYIVMWLFLWQVPQCKVPKIFNTLYIIFGLLFNTLTSLIWLKLIHVFVLLGFVCFWFDFCI